MTPASMEGHLVDRVLVEGTPAPLPPFLDWPEWLGEGYVMISLSSFQAVAAAAPRRI